MSAAKRYAPVPGRIPGEAFNLGGVDLVFAPLNLDGVREFDAAQKRFIAAAGERADGIEAMTRACADVLLLSLRRNYPDMTADDVAALLDLGNMEPAIMVMCHASGMRQAAAGESAPAPT